MTPSPPQASSLPRWLPPVLLLVALVAGGALAVLVGRLGHHAPATTVATVFDAPRPMPAFELSAHDGSAFGTAQLRGHYTLILFGYTNCPDVCPTTLLELARAHRLLADLPRDRQPAVVMISVDPARDTAERLAAYVPHFDPAFVGVTGPVGSIDALAAALGVVIERGEPRDGAYGVDHSATLFLVGPDARLVAEFPAPHVGRTIAADLRAILADGRG